MGGPASRQCFFVCLVFFMVLIWNVLWCPSLGSVLWKMSEQPWPMPFPGYDNGGWRIALVLGKDMLRIKLGLATNYY